MIRHDYFDSWLRLTLVSGVFPLSILGCVCILYVWNRSLWRRLILVVSIVWACCHLAAFFEVSGKPVKSIVSDVYNVSSFILLIAFPLLVFTSNPPAIRNRLRSDVVVNDDEEERPPHSDVQ